MIREMVYLNKMLVPGIVLDSGVYMGYEYLVLSYGTHPCAYVVLDEGDEYYGCDIDSVDISVHGGLSFGEDNICFLEYSEKYGCDVLSSINGKWIIGWDYGHYGDYTGFSLCDGGRKYCVEDILCDVYEVIGWLLFLSIQ